MNNGTPIIDPTAMQVAASYMPGPLATPGFVPLRTPAGVQLLAVGGATRLEVLAAQIAAGMIAKNGVQVDAKAIAKSSCEVALAILQEVNGENEEEDGE